MHPSARLLAWSHPDQTMMAAAAQLSVEHFPMICACDEEREKARWLMEDDDATVSWSDGLECIASSTRGNLTCWMADGHDSACAIRRGRLRVAG